MSPECKYSLAGVCLSESGFYSVAQADLKLTLLPQLLRARVTAVSHRYLSFPLDEPERAPQSWSLHLSSPPTSVGTLLLLYILSVCVAVSSQLNKQTCSTYYI